MPRRYALSVLTKVASPISATITATIANGRFDGSITVATFTGTARKVGASAGRTGDRASVPSITLKTTRAGSLVWASGLDYDHAAAITPLTGQSLVHQFRDARVDRTYWAQRTNDAISESGKTVTLGDTRPTTDRWELAAVEVVAASDATAGGSPVSYTYDKQGNRTSVTPEMAQPQTSATTKPTGLLATVPPLPTATTVTACAWPRLSTAPPQRSPGDSHGPCHSCLPTVPITMSMGLAASRSKRSRARR